MATKLFTVEEANALLPFLSRAFEEIFALRQQVIALRPEEDWPALEKAAYNGGGRQAGELFQLLNTFEALMRKIEATGCVVKDVEIGLVDFPSLRQGQVVYLCWKYKEPTIAYWHTIDGGFAGRQPL
jgi:hypothetical protein